MTWQLATPFSTRNEVWWIGKRIRLRRDIKTHCGDVYTAGMIFRVDRKWAGLEVSRPKGVITRLPYRDVDVELET